MNLAKAIQDAADSLDGPGIRNFVPHVQKDTTTILLMAILIAVCSKEEK